jgi:hypothetical protein
MSIRTLAEQEYAPGVIVALVEITEPDQERRLVYEVSCEACDTLAVGLSQIEAEAEAAHHDHHIERGRE